MGLNSAFKHKNQEYQIQLFVLTCIKLKPKPMQYQVVKIEGSKLEIAPDGSSLTMSEAETLLKEIHLMEMCQVCAIVTPIVTLWFSTKLGAFAVNLKNRHYEYKIMVDHFSEFGNLFNPKKVIYPIFQQN